MRGSLVGCLAKIYQVLTFFNYKHFVCFEDELLNFPLLVKSVAFKALVAGT